MDAPAIVIDNLRFRWPGSVVPCLDIPTMEVQRGESVFMHGPSGSGKSTLLGVIGGVLIPESGTIRVLDQPLGLMNSAARDQFRADHIGFIFQQFNLVPYLSVIDNVLLACRFSKKRRAKIEADDKSLRGEAEHLLTSLDIEQSLLSRKVVQLSVGQQQRVAAARALIGCPEIVIADEPTSSLDANRQAAFLDLLLGECIKAGVTLIFVSHDLRLTSRFSRVISLLSVNQVAADADAA